MAADELKREDLDKWFELHDQRRALERQASDLKKQADRIEPKIWAFIKKHGGRSRAVSKWGFNLAVRVVRASISWKSEFIAAMGQQKADELMAAAPEKETLSVERVAR